jgi:UDP-N-acetyl-2-amino-2-deoxyglucuronate dehydrogenase
VIGATTSNGGQDFALVGAAGYVAPRHMRAIRDTGNRLVAALDPKDSVGIIDSYFPDADFFVEFERFDRALDKRRRRGEPVSYISICSPNYLHDAHIRHALRNHAHAICEKPLVLNPWNLDALKEMEEESGKLIYNILQLRLHPAIIALRERVAANGRDQHDVDVTYITSRGRWYGTSWKGESSKAGGIATNIGVHLFDMLVWVFGGLTGSVVHLNRPECAAGRLDLERARVRWFLSIDAKHLPPERLAKGQRSFRSFRVDGEEFEFSDGFTELHTESYRGILGGRGFGIEDARAAIDIVYRLRNAAEAPLANDYHPLCAALGNS